MSDQAENRQQRLLDLPAFARRLRVAAAALAVLALIGAAVDGMLTGLEFAGLLQWFGLFLVALVVVGAILVAVDAYRGADRAQRQGQRLSGRDVGMLPPRRGGARRTRN
ncbi:MAG TPA: hypothetical protein VML96_05035 [Egibacteraceae bacterium]|nr:hypothetical protein [Egibacteraceae bacterium]